MSGLGTGGRVSQTVLGVLAYSLSPSPSFRNSRPPNKLSRHSSRFTLHFGAVQMSYEKFSLNGDPFALVALSASTHYLQLGSTNSARDMVSSTLLLVSRYVVV